MAILLGTGANVYIVVADLKWLVLRKKPYRTGTSGLDMEDGYIKLYRLLIKKPIWLNSTPEHKSIMITLLLLANHEPAEWEWMGIKFKVARGQFVTSLEKIREKTGKGISIQNVRSCLKRLGKLDFATDEATKAGRLITIINWDSYQPKEKKATKIPTIEQQGSNKAATPNKNNKNNKKELYTSNFLNFWEQYPKKVGKGSAFTSYKKIKEPTPSLKTILESVSCQKKSDQWQDRQYIPNPATWLNQRRWEDELDPINGNDPDLTSEEIREKHGL